MTDDRRKEVHDRLKEIKLIPVIGTGNLNSLEDVLSMARALHKGGCDNIEFLLRDGDAVSKIINKETFDAIRKEIPGMLIGVGTIATPHDIDLAHEAGADYVVSASFRWANVERANDHKMFYLPGVGSLQHFTELMAGDERSPGSNKTVFELLGGKDIATLKVHGNTCGELSELVPKIEAQLLNEHQRNAGIIPQFGLEPSELAQNGWTINRLVAVMGANPHVHMSGGNYMYNLPDGKGGRRDLLQEKNWEGVETLTRYVVDATHGRTPNPLPISMQAAVGDQVTLARQEAKVAGASR